MDNINIEEIMAQIKREIKEKGLTPDMLSFEDVPYKKPETVTSGASLGDADKALEYLNSHYTIQPYKELKGNPIKVFFKKVLRKLMKFYVEPVVFEQNDFNINTVNVLNAYRGTIGGGDESSEDKLREQVETLALAQKELSIRIEKLERENAQLREQLSQQVAE